MYSIARKPKAKQQANPTVHGRAAIWQTRDMHFILRLQRTIGNHGVRQLLQRETEDLEAYPAGNASTAFAHGLGRTPQDTGERRNLPPRLKVNEPGDLYEQEAEQAANRVMTLSDPAGSGRANRSETQEAVSHGPDAGHASVRNNASDGQTLDPGARQFFEPRFGYSFANVRVHSDRSANESARRLRAHAFTVGEHISFATGAYQPTTQRGRNLLAHELAHVVQQSRQPNHLRSCAPAASLSRVPAHAVQRKLVATGDPAGFAALANSVIEVQQEVVVSPAGLVSLRSTNVQGPPTLAAQELVSVLTAVINGPQTTTIEFIHGASSARASDVHVIVGNYGLSRIDLDDISAFGLPGGRGLNAGTALAHEILEQQRKQVHGESYPVAHAAGLAAEARAAGATITPGPLTQINATTIEIKDIYLYPDGTREEVTIVISSGNVTSVARRTLP